ncbi:MAG: hypothetical protein K8T25_06675 [Planctomycetia bacterium]|nr:hypothetical protein [Planctomycetia bacterium]
MLNDPRDLKKLKELGILLAALRLSPLPSGTTNWTLPSALSDILEDHIAEHTAQADGDDDDDEHEPDDAHPAEAATVQFSGADDEADVISWDIVHRLHLLWNNDPSRWKTELSKLYGDVERLRKNLANVGIIVGRIKPEYLTALLVLKFRAVVLKRSTLDIQSSAAAQLSLAGNGRPRRRRARPETNGEADRIVDHIFRKPRRK